MGCVSIYLRNETDTDSVGKLYSGKYPITLLLLIATGRNYKYMIIVFIIPQIRINQSEYNIPVQ